MSQRPVDCCYWVEEGRLLAGEYPAGGDPAGLRAAVAALRDAGITAIVDLTEEGELAPYGEFLDGIRWERRAIRDFSAPTPAELAATLDAIDALLAEGERVYLHCWGGRGRTGTVVACYLVRHGASPDEALARVTELLGGTPKAGQPSPETEEQIRLVRSWLRGQ